MRNAFEIKQILAARAEEICAILLPAGKKSGGEWCVGSVSGEPGNSLKVRVSGVKAGLWSDFSTGEAGDLLDLWKAVRGGTFVEALKQARDFLGIAGESTHRVKPAPAPAQKQYVRPALDRHEPLVTGGPVYDYLVKTRQLDPEVLRRYRIQQMDHGQHGPTCVFPIFEPSGLAVDLVKYLAVKRRDDGKKLIFASKDSRPHLFGWQAIDKNARIVVITEGEIDALTIAGWGFPALSVHSGAENLDWVQHDFDSLDRFVIIYIATDADAPGDACAEAIAQRLGRERCLRLRFPGFKDANEAEVAGGFTGPDFEALLASAEAMDPKAIRNAADFADAAWLEQNPTPEMIGSSTPWGIDWRIRDGEVTIWTGWSGHGKSHLLNQVLVHDWFTFGSRALIASMEMPPAQTLSQLITMTGAMRPKSQYELNEVVAQLAPGFWFYDVVGVALWREFLPEFAYAIRKYGIKRIVVDSLLRCGVAEDDYDGQKDFVSALVAFAAEHKIHIHLVAHARKKDDESRPPGKLDIRGAAAITDLVHNGWSVWRNKEREQQIAISRSQSPNGTIDPSLLAQASAEICCWKNRRTGIEPFQRLWLNQSAMQFCDAKESYAKRYLKSETKS